MSIGFSSKGGGTMSCCPSETNSEKERQLTTILYKGDSVSIDQKEAALALKPSKSGIVKS